MLAAPHIIAADNREAHILVGQSIPILTADPDVDRHPGTVGAAISQVQYRDTGKILTVLPQVNSQGPREPPDPPGGERRAADRRQRRHVVRQHELPAFSTREAETTVVVQDGETVLIGGIIDDAISHARSGIPYLMDVPFLGRAFRSDSDKVDRTGAPGHHHALGHSQQGRGAPRDRRLQRPHRGADRASPRHGAQRHRAGVPMTIREPRSEPPAISR